MFIRTDNPLADFDAYEWEREKQLKRRPKCDHCKEHIQDDYLYEIQGELICEECLEKHYRKHTEDFEQE